MLVVYISRVMTTRDLLQACREFKTLPKAEEGGKTWHV